LRAREVQLRSAGPIWQVSQYVSRPCGIGYDSGIAGDGTDWAPPARILQRRKAGRTFRVRATFHSKKTPSVIVILFVAIDGGTPALRNLSIVVPNVVRSNQTASLRNDNLLQVIDIIGGRTRTRTLDPLIKSLQEQRDTGRQIRTRCHLNPLKLLGLSISVRRCPGQRMTYADRAILLPLRPSG
jgi:hypothetical protein